VIRSAANDAPRFDHNPLTGECLGLLVEEQRVNSIRNNTMVGAVAGTPGTLPTNWGELLAGLTREVVATGTSNGISYIDIRLSGTTNSTSLAFNFESGTQIAAATGQSWSLSTWLAVVGGSTTNITSLYLNYVERTSAGGLVTLQNGPNFVSSANSTFSRYLSTTTLAGGATTAFVQPRLLLGFASGAAIDITLRIGLPQLEQGAFATSVIPTTTAAATRTADVASISGTNFSSWYRQDEGTVFALSSPNQVANSPVLIDLNDTTTTNRSSLGVTTGRNGQMFFTTAGVSQGATSTANVLTLNASASFALAYKSDDCAICLAGASPASDATVSLPTVTSLFIGFRPTSQHLNGPISRLAYWPQRLQNNVLQSITL
jgi:hypothetical protein